MRLVLDTNVLVSALFWNGDERRLLMQCFEGDHVLVTSPDLVAEAERVLVTKFSYPKTEAREFLDLVQDHGVVVSPTKRLAIVVLDPSDDRVLECAIEGRAARIVTGDRHLLKLGSFRGIEIMRASAAIEDR